MTTLYRSPSHLIDGVEWYLAVESATEAQRPSTRPENRVQIIMRWRPHGHKAGQWAPLSKWSGPLPKGFREFFRPYMRQADIARLPLEKRRRL